MTIQFLSNVSYPQNNEDEFPVGQEIIFLFSESVDIKKIKESFVLYGQDFDRTSGPDNALWLNTQSGENPFFLRSPGFKGFVAQEFIPKNNPLESLDRAIRICDV